MNPLSLYIHFPFCVRKCLYCDFLSGPGTPEAMTSYINDLKNEIIFRGQFFNNHTVVSIFFGGGTPSLLSAIQMTEIMTCIRSVFHIAANAEITCECNPGTLSEDKLRGFLDAGINRLSIGLQSTNDQELQMLGRIHRYEQFEHNYQLARTCGFKNINVDLMSALPGQSVTSYEMSLKKVLALHPEHISAYSLIIEDGTPFADALPAPLPSEDDERLMYHITKTMLAAHGYARYEISNYARPGFECQHNIVYWTRKNYLGLGLGSSSLINEQRFSNPTDMQAYHQLWVSDIDALRYCCTFGTEQYELLDTQAQMEEFMFLGLRLTNGISPKTFEDYFHVPITTIYGAVIDKHLRDGTLVLSDDRLYLTERGMDVANYVMSDFIL